MKTLTEISKLALSQYGYPKIVRKMVNFLGRVVDQLYADVTAFRRVFSILRQVTSDRKTISYHPKVTIP